MADTEGKVDEGEVIVRDRIIVSLLRKVIGQSMGRFTISRDDLDSTGDAVLHTEWIGDVMFFDLGKKS